MDKSEFKILVAEDDGIVRDVILKFLTGEGYPVVLANDGLSALNLLRLEDINLVLTDLRMPGADGMEVLRSAMQINPKISVVLLTAYGTLDMALEAIKAGAYDFIVKPFVMQQLLLVVRNAFKMATLMKENEKLSEQLKETYRNFEAYKNANKNLTGGVGDNNGKHEKVMAIDNEAGVFGKRLVSGNENDNMKKYSNLVNELKNQQE